jgi:Ca2+/H+ antiporter
MLAAALQVNPPLVFVIAFVALIPLAHLVAEATESLAARTGPKIGGLRSLSCLRCYAPVTLTC